MNTIDKSRVKNAPLDLPEDQSDFVAWAMSVPDGSISAGWQPTHAHLEPKQNGVPISEMHAVDPNDRAKLAGIDASRRSLAKFLEFSRRRLGDSLEDIAEKTGIGLEELVAVETGEGIAHAQTLQRLATFLGVNPQRLLQLAGLAPAENRGLKQAALHFVARAESVKPLEPEEHAALKRFYEEALDLELSPG